VQNCDEGAARLVFSGRTVRLTVEPRVIMVTRAGLLARLRGRSSSTIERSRIVDVQVLPWGSALLLVTADGEAMTFESGAAAQAARDAILCDAPCAAVCTCERCATLTPREG
jgi:hypothetical protein